MKRFFTNVQFDRVSQDFKFLIRMLKKSYGEYDLSIRENYFNIYYKGNSLAKITLSKNDYYLIEIHKKFFENSKAQTTKYYESSKLDKTNYRIHVKNIQLHKFFQRAHLNDLSSKIKKINNGEEINFEQALITDNLNNKNYIFIDRQVAVERKLLDLLILKKNENNKYNFLLAEVKLGNNKELKKDVIDQLALYYNHIKDNFTSYKKCYELQYEQKNKLGLIESAKYDQIEIIEPVEKIIIVGGYSGTANEYIKELTRNDKDVKIKHFTYQL